MITTNFAEKLDSKMGGLLLGQYISNIRNIKITTPRYSIITLLITSDEEKNFKWLEKTKGV